MSETCSDIKTDEGVVTSKLPTITHNHSSGCPDMSETYSDVKTDTGVVTSKLPTITHEQSCTKQSEVDTEVDSKVIFHTKLHTYHVISYPESLYDNEYLESILWMRTVFRHLKTIHTPMTERKQLFTSRFGVSKQQLQIYNQKFPKEGSLLSSSRVKYRVVQNKFISAQTAHERAKKRCRRTAKKMKSDQEDVFRAIATLIRFGLLQSGGKYEHFRRIHKRVNGQSSGTYGISLAKYPNAETVNALANAIYKHPDLLTNSPDWVIKYRKGRLKLIDEQLFLPTQQITVSKIPLQRSCGGLETTIDNNSRMTEEASQSSITEDIQQQTRCGDLETTTDNKSQMTEEASQSSITEDIQQVLKTWGLEPVVIKVRKGTTSAAAYVYFESAYAARGAVQPLRQIGVVSLGQTIVTARVVASKVIHVIHTLLSEADGILSQTYPPGLLNELKTNVKSRLHLQEWIDKDGRVTFIKLKLVDPSYTIFQRGESRVLNLLEYVGDECECRRFYPILVDQFAECNRTVFELQNGLPLRVILTLCSGDHKAAWHKTGRSGGHEQRDLFSDLSRASLYHLFAYQDKPNFKYSRHVKTYKKVQALLTKWTREQIQAQHITTQAERKAAAMNVYYTVGRVERVPALTNGEHSEQPSVYEELYLTPLVLHNQTHCNLVTLELGLKYIVTADSPCLKKLQGRLRGLQDGIGTTKCATSGTGIRNLINDCLILEKDTHADYIKYSPIWYLMDLICFHLKLKHKTTSRTPVALMDHERLAFSSSTFLWWALIGDLSSHTGGRTLKNGTKNHLEDKIYAYELVNACPEWEEITKIPLSLIDEAIFEASFAPRDQMINNQRTKIGILGERKIRTFHDMANVLAPVKKYRSIMSHLPRHIRRNIIIRQCWQSQPKWSLNISNGFLRRCVRYSYRDRIFLSFDQDIFLNLTGPLDPFYNMDSEHPIIVIDPCGTCHATPIPSVMSASIIVTEEKKSSLCHIPLKTWWATRIIRRAFIRSRIQKQHTHRLRICNLKRARRHESAIRAHVRRRVADRDPIEFKASFDGYVIFQRRYPQDLQNININRVMHKLLDDAKEMASSQELDIWNGDISTLPDDIHDISTDRAWTVAKLKSILRFFKVQGITDRDRIKLGGARASLISRVIPLLLQFKLMEKSQDL